MIFRSNQNPKETGDAIESSADARSKYWERFTGGKKIGRETEYLAVSLGKGRYGESIDVEESRAGLRRLALRGFSPSWLHKDSGPLYGWCVTDKVSHKQIGAQIPMENGYMDIKTDFGCSVYEFPFPAFETIDDIKSYSDNVMGRIVPVLNELEIGLIGSGAHPLTAPNRNLMMGKSRYITLRNRYTTQHRIKGESKDIHFHTISASEQIHIDVNADEAIRAINAFNCAAPYMTALFANSSLLEGKPAGYKDVRELFWEWTINLGRDQERKGIPKMFEDHDDYLDTIWSFEPIMTFVRLSHKDISTIYAEFYDTPSMSSFLDKMIGNIIVPGSKENPYLFDVNGRKVGTTQPTMVDIYTHDSSVWYCARLKSITGTLELRMMSQQPYEERMLPTAFIMGLAEKLDAFCDYIESYPKLRTHIKDLHTRTINDGIFPKIVPVLEDLVFMSKEGLKERGENPNILEPLEERIALRQTPADVALHILKEKGITGVIDYYRIPIGN